MSPPSLVIFDCDGVLVDSERIAVEVDAQVLAAVGLEMTREEIIDRFVGRHASVMTAAIENHLGHPITAELQDRFDALYRDAFAADLEPVDGIVEALSALEAAGLAMCVASSSQMPNLRRKLDMTGLTRYFGEAIYSADQVRHGKPAPDLFLFAAERMDHSPDTCVVVEDSQYGVTAARAAGMRVLGFHGGITSAGSLRQDGAVLFDDMRELPGLIEAFGASSMPRP